MPWDRNRVEELKPLIQAKIDALVAGMTRYAEVADVPNELPRARPPASAQALSRYEAALGLPLPNSYRAFLELHDGYDYLIPTGPMFSTTEAIPGGAFFDQIREWKQTTSDYGGGEVLDGIVIGYHGQPNNWAYLDPNQRREEGELAVISFTPEMSADFANLLEFFDYCLEVVRLSLERVSSS